MKTALSSMPCRRLTLWMRQIVALCKPGESLKFSPKKETSRNSGLRFSWFQTMARRFETCAVAVRHARRDLSVHAVKPSLSAGRPSRMDDLRRLLLLRLLVVLGPAIMLLWLRFGLTPSQPLPLWVIGLFLALVAVTFAGLYLRVRSSVSIAAWELFAYLQFDGGGAAPTGSGSRSAA